MADCFLSILICTHNRAVYLEKLLESLLIQTLSQELFEVIIIDNASEDNTREIANKYNSLFKNYTYHYEDKIGLSYARNTGLKISKGNIISYIDDDGTVNKKWAEVIYTIFTSKSFIPAVLGGKIIPDWEIERPSWFPDEMFSYISCLDNGLEPKKVSYLRIYGGNIAYQKDKVVYYGEFNTKLGRTAKEQLTHEERLLLYNMQENNEILFYHPEMILYHYIPKERATYKYLVDRAFGAGKSGAILDSISSYKHKDVITILFRDILFLILSFVSLKEKKYRIMCSIRILYHISFVYNRVIGLIKKL